MKEFLDSLKVNGSIYVPPAAGHRYVWYCTNRSVGQPSATDPTRFSSEIGNTEYGYCEVCVDRNRAPGQMIRKEGSYFYGRKTRKLIDADERPLHRQTAAGVYLMLNELHMSSRRQHSLFFVHGYNVTFGQALERAAQLAEDLHIDGEVFLFSWPSQGRTEGYVGDQDRAYVSPRSTQALNDCLKLIHSITHQWQNHKLHIVAHSMGNRVVLPELANFLSVHGASWKIGQLISAAADAEKNELAAWLEAIRGNADGVSILYSTNDLALKASEFAHTSNRAGRDPPLGPWDVIDCSGLGEDFWKHSYVFDSPHVVLELRNIVAGYKYTQRNVREVDRQQRRYLLRS